jgi:hypothetical protein
MILYGSFVTAKPELGGEQATIEFWQTRRGGGLRGIIEIVENVDD